MQVVQCSSTDRMIAVRLAAKHARDGEEFAKARPIQNLEVATAAVGAALSATTAMPVAGGGLLSLPRSGGATPSAGP